jgi:ribosome recycling factor
MGNLDQAKTKMQAAIEHFKTELKNIRTGRANPGMLDGVLVEVYGSNMRLKDIASVTVPEARQLLISPFDRTNVSAIAKGIEKANLGFMPIVDGHVVRLKIGQMDEATRKSMIKICHTKLEETKVSVRGVRRDVIKHAQDQKKSGDMAEDALRKFEKDVQDLTDKFCKEADDLCKKKEEEVLTV